MNTSDSERLLIDHIFTLATQQPTFSTRERVAHALLDWFTAGWATNGNTRATNIYKLAKDVFGANDEAPVFGSKHGLSTVAAAFANAGITHICEIDDAHRAAMLHPGIVSISPVLALAASRPATYDKLTNSIIVGYEVALRVGEALGPGHSGNFHATATAGALAAAAAAAVVLDCNKDQLQHALGIAATQAAGLWQMLDDGAHHSKPLHPAFAVRNGMTAAYAARLGFPGARAFITGSRGLYALMKGDGPLDVLRPHHFDEPKIHTATIKAWPCCAQLFTPLDAVRSLMQEHQVTHENFEEVHVDIFPHALKIANVAWPTSPSEAPFSLRYLIASLLYNDRLNIKDVEGSHYLDKHLIDLSKRINVTPRPEYQEHYPHKRISKVTITLKDGRVISKTRELRRGDPEDPFDWDEIYLRMRNFAPVLSDRKADAIADWCNGFSNSDGTRICQVPSNLFQ